MEGAMMRSAWARLQDFICRATDTKYPAQRYSFNWDKDSGNASLKILGKTYRYTSASEAAGKEGCAREGLSEGLLFTIIEQADPPAGKAAELKKLALGYANLNRLPRMEELYPSAENGFKASPLPVTNSSSTTPHIVSYNGPLPNIPSLALPTPSSAKERLQIFIADIFGQSSVLFDQIDFVQAKAGASPWSIILCQREYTSQYIYRDKEDGQEAAVRVALEKGALAILLKEHSPQPHYHAAAIDLVAKFSHSLGLYPLPPPIGRNPGSRTPIPGQTGSATPSYVPMQAGAASPYYPVMSLPSMSPYHVPAIPMSPYHSGYVSDAMYVSASEQAGPGRSSRGRSSSRHDRSRSRSKHRSSSKHRSPSRHRSSSRHRNGSRRRRRPRRERSESSYSSASSEPRSMAGSATESDTYTRGRRHRHRRKKSLRLATEEHRDSETGGMDSRWPGQHLNGLDEGLSEDGTGCMPLVQDGGGAHQNALPVQHTAGFSESNHSALGTEARTPGSIVSGVGREFNANLSPYLDYLLECLEPGHQNVEDDHVRVKEESPDLSLPFPRTLPKKVNQPDLRRHHATLVEQLDSGNRHKLEMIREACTMALSMQNIRQAAAEDAAVGAEEELVIVPRKWVLDALEVFEEIHL